MSNSDQYLGLTKKSAQNLSEAQNLIFRLISIDGEAYFGYPEDTRTDRICVEINNGAVTKASIQ